MASSCQIMHYRHTVINIQRERSGCIGNKEKVAVSVTYVNSPSPPNICKEALVQTGSVMLYLHINKKICFVARLQNPGSLFVMSSVCVWNIKAATVVSLIVHTAKQQRAVLRVICSGLNERWGAAFDVCFMIGSIHWLMQVWNNKGKTKSGLILELVSTRWPLRRAPAGSSQQEIYGPAHKDFITSHSPPRDPYRKCFTSAVRLISIVFLCG